MTRMTGPDCAVMCNLINTHRIPPWEDQCEWHRMTRMTGPDCAVMCNLINTHTHTTGTTITGTRIGLGRAEGGQKSARNRKIAVDAVRETGETWVESEKNVEKKGLVQ